MGEDLSNSAPHQVVEASPFQLGWKAVAVRSKQLPQGDFGGAAPEEDGEPVDELEDEEEEEEAEDEAAEPEAEAEAEADALAEADACELEEPDEEPDDEPEDEPEEACEPEPEPELDDDPALAPALEPAEAFDEEPLPCLGLVLLLVTLEGRFLEPFLQTFRR